MSVLPPQGRGLAAPFPSAWGPPAAASASPKAAATAAVATGAPQAGPTFAGWGQYFPAGMPFPQGPPIPPGVPLAAPMGPPAGVPGPPSPPPQLEVANMQIAALMDLYQQQLVEISAAHSLLLVDQERLAALLAPFVDASGAAVLPLDENLLFMKRDAAASVTPSAFAAAAVLGVGAGFAESRLMGQVKDLRKVVNLLQFELDELRFQRDVYADEARRLRGVCRYGSWVQDGLADPLTPRKMSPRTLHQKYSGAPVQKKAEAVIGTGSAGVSGQDVEGGPSKPERDRRFSGKRTPRASVAADDQSDQAAETGAPAWTRIFSGLLPGSKEAPKTEDAGGRGGPHPSSKGAPSRGPQPSKSTAGAALRRKTEAAERDRAKGEELQARRKTAPGLERGGAPGGPEQAGGPPAARRGPPKETFSGAPGGPREAPIRHCSSPFLPPTSVHASGAPTRPQWRELPSSASSSSEKQGRGAPPALLRTRSSDLFSSEHFRLPPHSHSDEGLPHHPEPVGPLRGAPLSLSGSSSERSVVGEGPPLRLEKFEPRSCEKPRRYPGREEGEVAGRAGGPPEPPSYPSATPQDLLLGRLSKLSSRTIPSPHAGSPPESGRPSEGAPPGWPRAPPPLTLPSRQASVAFLGSVQEEEKRRDSSSSSMGGPHRRREGPRRMPSRSLSRSPPKAASGTIAAAATPAAPAAAAAPTAAAAAEPASFRLGISRLFLDSRPTRMLLLGTANFLTTLARSLCLPADYICLALRFLYLGFETQQQQSTLFLKNRKAAAAAALLLAWKLLDDTDPIKSQRRIQCLTRAFYRVTHRQQGAAVAAAKRSRQQQQQQEEEEEARRACSSSLWLLRDLGVSWRHLGSLIKSHEVLLLQSLSFRLGGPFLFSLSALTRHVKLLLQPCSSSSSSSSSVVCCCCSRWPQKGRAFAALLHAMEACSREQLLLLSHTPLALEVGAPVLAAAAPVAAAIALGVPFVRGPYLVGGPSEGPPKQAADEHVGPPHPKRIKTEEEARSAAAAASTAAEEVQQQLAAFDVHVHHYLAAAAALCAIPGTAAAAAAAESDPGAEAAAAELHPRRVQEVLQLLRQIRMWEADLVHARPLLLRPKHRLSS
ncbi:hypothetical protein Esti_000445 [Eimeria stiedai]